MIIAAAAAIAYSKPIGAVMLADSSGEASVADLGAPHLGIGARRDIPQSEESERGEAGRLRPSSSASARATPICRTSARPHAPVRPRARLLEVLSSIFPFALLAPFGALGGSWSSPTVKDKLGGRFIAGISGGGALPPAVDRFFDALGILILEGYGLTETAPVIGVREQRPRRRNRRTAPRGH